ncbi:MAG: leucine-rich repeat domain-containing protein, partial [Ruminiclostridium sp.]|nr:leucine-rich repeat domain-containing protein [Ruminiclostridium sp.]
MKNKQIKLAAAALTGVMVLSAVPCGELTLPLTVTASAASYKVGDTFTYEGSKYEVVKDGIKLISFGGKINNDGNVLLPPRVNGLTLVEIGDNAFKNWSVLHDYVIPCLHIPNGVKKVGANIAKIKNSHFSYVYFPDTLESVDKKAFDGSKLENATYYYGNVGFYPLDGNAYAHKENSSNYDKDRSLYDEIKKRGAEIREAYKKATIKLIYPNRDYIDTEKTGKAVLEPDIKADVNISSLKVGDSFKIDGNIFGVEKDGLRMTLLLIDRNISYADDLVLPKSVNGIPIVEVNFMVINLKANRLIIPEGVKRLKGSIESTGGKIYLPLSLKSFDKDFFRKTSSEVIYNDIVFFSQGLSEDQKTEWNDVTDYYIYLDYSEDTTKEIRLEDVIKEYNASGKTKTDNTSTKTDNKSDTKADTKTDTKTDTTTNTNKKTTLKYKKLWPEWSVDSNPDNMSFPELYIFNAAKNELYYKYVMHGKFGTYTVNGKKVNLDEEFNGFIQTYPAKATVTIPAVIDMKVPKGVPSNVAKKIKGMYIRYVGDGYNIFYVDSGDAYGNKETTVKTLNISEGIEAIGGNAFISCVNLSKVSLPKTLTRIEDGAFNGCTSLKSIELPNTNLMIGSSAFSGSGLTSITIPSKLRSLNDSGGVNIMGGKATTQELLDSCKGSFSQCKNLTTVKFDCMPKGLYFYMFGGSPVKKVILTNTLLNNKSEYCLKPEDWGGNFSALYELNEIVLPDKLTFIPASLAADCKKLTKIELPSGITEIRGSAFSGCESLKNIALPAGLKEIENWAFKNCTKLSSITLPKNLEVLDGGVFEGCTSLKSITVPDKVKELNYTFKGCTSLTSVTLPKNLEEMNGTFEGCTNLQKITLPSKLKEIGAGTFDGTSITSLTIPGSVKEIDNAFEGADKLKTVTFAKSSNDLVLAGGFYDCKSLTTVDMSKLTGNVNIRMESFKDCKNLTTVKLPKNLAFLDESAFEN